MFYTAPYVMLGKWGEGWALEIETISGSEMATSEASAIWAKKSRFPGHNPLPLA